VEQAGRDASPTAAILDSQSVKVRGKKKKKGPLHRPAWLLMAGKKIKGKKRHILVDTQGLLMHAIVHGADISGSRRWRLADGDPVWRLFHSCLSSTRTAATKGRKFQAAVQRTMAQVNV